MNLTYYKMYTIRITGELKITRYNSQKFDKALVMLTIVDKLARNIYVMKLVL